MTRIVISIEALGRKVGTVTILDQTQDQPISIEALGRDIEKLKITAGNSAVDETISFDELAGRIEPPEIIEQEDEDRS